MRQIKTLITREAKKKDTCLFTTQLTDCTDLTTLEQKLADDEKRLQKEFTKAVRASKSSLAPQPSIGNLTTTVDDSNLAPELGRLSKLPMIGLQVKPNFHWSLYSMSHQVPRPDCRLQALSSEWSQSLTRLQLHFASGMESQALTSATKGQSYHRSLFDQTKNVSALVARINQSSQRIYDIGFQYDGKTNVVQTVTGDSADQMQCVEVPDGHVIVGLYGVKGEERIQSFGLITWSQK